MTQRPNVLFIITDQQNFHMMSNAGNTQVHTPAIDSLVSSGVRFDRAYCTNPVCVPSRFSLMTGRMPSEIGMRSNNLSHIPAIPGDIVTSGLGWLMRAAGYDVAYGGKMHLPRMTAADIGFEYICKDERDVAADTCATYIRQPKDKPFFLVVSLINPHDICYMAINDLQETEEERSLVKHSPARTIVQWALQRPDGLDEDTFFNEYCPPLPPNYEPQEDEPEAIRFMLEQRPFRLKARAQWSDRRWREHRWAYARLTEVVDAQIARVLAALKESGHWDDTLIIFTSDHGDMDAAHRMEHKGVLYEEACHIPLIVRPPGGTSGCVDARPVSNGLDLLPTFCDYAGVKPPEGLLGQSLRPILEKRDNVLWRKSLPIESAVGRGLVTDRYKYAMYDMGSSREQLYDLHSDPYEQRNALHDKQHQSALTDLRAQFNSMFAAEERCLDDLCKDAAKG